MHRGFHGAARVVSAATSAAAILLGSSRAAAQQHTELAVSGGLATDQAGTRSRALVFAPLLAWNEGLGAWVVLGATLARYEHGALAVGGHADLERRDLIAEPLSFTLDASASLSRLDAKGRAAAFASGDALPALEIAIGPLAFLGGLRLAAGHLAQSGSRPIVPSVTSGSRMAAGPVFGMSFGTDVAPSGYVEVGFREGTMRIEGSTLVDRVLSLRVAGPAARVRGDIGRRVSGVGAGERFGAAAVDVTVLRGIEFIASAGWYLADPLVRTRGGSYVNAGFALQADGGGFPRAHDPRDRRRGNDLRRRG